MKLTTIAGIAVWIAVLAAPVSAQPVQSPAPYNFGTHSVGTSTAITLTYSFTQSYFMGNTPAVVTQGIVGKDFTQSGGTCATGTWLAGQSCTVQVTFTPQYPGLRMGAVVLVDNTGAPSTITYLQGAGAGPMPTIAPGVTQWSTTIAAQAVAVDAGDNVYLGGFFGLYTLDNTNLAIGFGTENAMAIDGAGNIYVSDRQKNCIWKTTPVLPWGTGTTSRTTTCLAPIAGQLVGGPLAVDGNGLLYYADGNSGNVVQYVPGTNTGQIAAICGKGSCEWGGVYAIALDGSGNLYVATPSGGTCYTMGANLPGGLSISCNGAVWKVPPTSSADPSGWTMVWKGAGAGYFGTRHARGLAVDGAGTVYILDTATQLWRVPQGSGPILLNTAGFPQLANWNAVYIALDQSGNAYVSDSLNQVVDKLGGPGFFPTIVTLDGACGSAATQTTTPPMQNLCSSGTPSPVSGAGPWTWTCAGTYGGAPASCTATIPTTPLSGVCGTAVNGTHSSPPTTDTLCAIGNPAPVPVNGSGSGPWTWTCAGLNGGNGASCSAAFPATGPVNGVCGPANGQILSSSPSFGLCAPGVSSDVTSSNGTWSWTCSGIRGGSTSPACSTIPPATSIPAGSVSTVHPAIGANESFIRGPYKVQADSAGNVYMSSLYSHGGYTALVGVAPVSSPGTRLLTFSNYGTWNDDTWAAFGNGKFCYWTQSGDTGTGFYCPGSFAPGNWTDAGIRMVADSTGHHLYSYDYWGKAIRDFSTVVASGGPLTYAGDLAIDPANNLYVSYTISPLCSVYEMDPATKILNEVTYTGSKTGHLTVDPSGGFYLVDGTHVYYVDRESGASVTLTIPNLTRPMSVALDGQGNLDIADYSDNSLSPGKVVIVSAAALATAKPRRPQNGYCGDAVYEFTTTRPTKDFCDTGTFSGLAGSGPWTWTCSGSNYGRSSSCSTYPALLTVTANNASMPQGGPLPTFTASYSGFVNGDDDDELSGTPALSTTATASSPAGTYPITVSQGTLNSSGLYTFQFVPGTLSVVAPPKVQLSISAVLSKQANAYQAIVTFTNSGAAAATNVALSTATLGAATGSPLPQTVGTVAAGSTASLTVTFPLSAGADGATVVAKFGGTYTGGTFSSSIRAVLP